MSKRVIKFNKITWINIDEYNDQDIEFLKKEFKFHPLDLKDLSDLEQTPKLDLYEDYIFLILHFPGYNKYAQQVTFSPSAIFLTTDCLVTFNLKFKKLRRLFFLIQKNSAIKKEYFQAGSDFLLYKILHYIFYETAEPVIKVNKQNIKELEQNIYEKKNSQQAVKSIAVLRRNILNLRSILEPQKSVLKNLSLLVDKKLIGSDLQVYFDDINDYINQVWGITANHREIIEGLNKTNESLISSRTNQIITTLTVISVALLPLTLFSSIYGMNIVLPFAHSPIIVWTIFIIIAIIIFIVLIYLNKKSKI